MMGIQLSIQAFSSARDDVSASISVILPANTAPHPIVDFTPRSTIFPEKLTVVS
jgi:hypothetical protein